MTKLELRICEAENMGEIDLDTRDMMLDVLGESTTQVRQADKIDKQMDEVLDKIENLRNLRDKFDREGNQRMVDATDKKIKKLRNTRRELFEKRRRIDPGDNARNARDYGQSKAISSGKLFAQNNPWRYNSKREEREPGRYKTTNGLKESVLFNEIYEAELCGDITAEERAALIGCVSEGSNLETLKLKYNAREKYIDSIKEANARFREGDYSGAIKSIDDAIKEIKDIKKNMESIDDTAMSVVIGFFLSGLGNIGRTLVTTLLSVPTLGLSKLFDDITRFIETLDHLKKKNKASGWDSITITDLNLMRNTILSGLEKYIYSLEAVRNAYKYQMKKDNNKLRSRVDNLEEDLANAKTKYRKHNKGYKAAVKNESVLEEIYEAELYGEITPEERMALIDYMND